MNTILRRSYMLLISVFYFSVANAQIDFKPGYVITNAGDSLRGELAYRVQKLSHKSAIFIGEDGVKKEMRPESIQAYGYDDGQRFQSGIVDEVFVIVLVESYLSLYEHGSIFYLKKSDEIITVSTKETTQSDGSVLTGEPLKIAHTRLVNSLVFDCSTEDQLSLTKSGLTRLVLNYNQCKGEVVNYNWKNAKSIEFHLSILGMFVKNQLEIESFDDPFLFGDNPFGETPFAFETSSVGVSFPIKLGSPQNGKSIFNIYLEPGFLSYSYSDHYERTNNTYTYEWDRRVKSSLVSLPVGGIFSFEQKRSVIEAMFGFNLGFVVQSQVDSYRTRTLLSNNQQTFASEEEYGFEGMEPGLIVGLGYKRKIGSRLIGLNVRYQTALETDLSGYNATYSGNRLGFGLSVNLIN
ncbi:MAG: hypothetical protein HWE21_02745 [Cytophagia bacterium]|nr:hypothetical protein [Cytophagia bacterium]